MANLQILGPSGLVDVSASHPVPVSPGDSTRVNSTAYESSHVLKASAGKLVGLVGYNSGPDQFIQIHDAAAVPADAEVPAITFKVGSGQNFSLDLPMSGVPFATGIVICNSSTGPTKQIGSADCFFTGVLL